MGAEGNIIIYNIEKLKNKYGDDADEYIKIIKDSITYVQDIDIPGYKRVQFITEYYGDNIYYDSTIRRILNITNKSPHFCDLEGYEIENIKKTLGLDKVIEINQFLLDNCEICDWEVWT